MLFYQRYPFLYFHHLIHRIHCGVLDENNTLDTNKQNYNSVLNKEKVEEIESEVVIEQPDTVIDDLKNRPVKENNSTVQQDNPLLIPEMVNAEQVKVRLTEGKFAYFVYPININKKDVLILQKEIDKLDILTS